MSALPRNNPLDFLGRRPAKTQLGPTAGDYIGDLGLALMGAGVTSNVPVGQRLVAGLQGAQGNYRQQVAQAAAAQAKERKFQLQLAEYMRKLGAPQSDLGKVYKDERGGLVPEGTAAGVAASKTTKYKERDFSLPGGMIQKQVSYDNGRSWEPVGEPYDRREPMSVVANDEGVFIVDKRKLGGGGGTGGAVTPLLDKTSDKQRSIGGFYGRARASNDIIKDLGAPAGKGELLALRNMVVDAGDAWASTMYADGSTQQYAQAALDFISAVLRKESGATLTADERSSEYAKYFPMPGDTEATITQKAQSRSRQLRALRQEAGKALKGVTTGPETTDALADEVTGFGVPVLRYDSQGNRIQ